MPTKTDSIALVSPETVADMTGYSVKTLANHRYRGDWPLRFVKLGTRKPDAKSDTRKVMYFLTDVEKFMRNEPRFGTEAV